MTEPTIKMSKAALISLLQTRNEQLDAAEQTHKTLLVRAMDDQDKLEEAEARDVVTHEYLQSWIDRANEAEQTIKEISELPRHIGTNSLGQVFSFIDPYELEAALNRSKP